MPFTAPAFKKSFASRKTTQCSPFSARIPKQKLECHDLDKINFKKWTVADKQ